MPPMPGDMKRALQARRIVAHGPVVSIRIRGIGREHLAASRLVRIASVRGALTCPSGGFGGRAALGVAPQRSGSQGALLLPSPLTTTRKPFGFCRSSLSQGPLRTPVAQAHHRHDTGRELACVTRRRPHQQASCCHLLGLPSQLFRRSRAETPEGSQPALAWGDLAGGLKPYPPDYRTAFASSLVLYPPSHRQPPCGGPTPRGGRRADHVPQRNHGWLRLCLSAGGRYGDGRGWESPCTWPRTFWFQPLIDEGRGAEPQHIAQTERYVRQVLELAKIERLSELSPSRVVAALAKYRSRQIRTGIP
jgi:hypothetical protein